MLAPSSRRLAISFRMNPTKRIWTRQLLPYTVHYVGVMYTEKWRGHEAGGILHAEVVAKEIREPGVARTRSMATEWVRDKLRSVRDQEHDGTPPLGLKRIRSVDRGGCNT